MRPVTTSSPPQTFPSRGHGRLSLIPIIVITYAAVTVLLPKLDLSSVTFYLTEPIFLLAVIAALARGRYHVVGPIDKTYLLFSVLSFLAVWEGFFYTGLVDFQAAVKTVKYVQYIAMVSFAIEYRDTIRARHVRAILGLEVAFIGVALLIVVANILHSHPAVSELIWGYSNRYRLVGFTGYALNGAHLVLVGTTSVSMGVFVAFVALLCSVFFASTHQIRYLAAAMIASIGELFTFSRTGVAVLLIGWLYLVWVNRKSARLWRTVVGLVVVVVVLVIALGPKIVDSIASVGSISRFASTPSGILDASTNQRVSYISEAIRYVQAHPASLLLGTGYGELYTFNLIGTPHLESLILTTLFQCGLVTTIVLLLHFFWIWSIARRHRRFGSSGIWRQIAVAIEAFVPGLLVANLIGGNSLQTDFFAPLLYFMIGFSLANFRITSVNENPHRP